MGRTSGDDDTNAPPTTVTLNPFYLQQSETTKAQWDEVRTWGLENGYSDLVGGGGKAPNHPVHSVGWIDVVKWCNARSEREGLTPVYRFYGSVFRTGTSVPAVNWTANGYRLPTEAEWEKAARGGVNSSRFPWGTDTISHVEANFQNSGGESYQTGSTGYHPTYAVGEEPYTSYQGGSANYYYSNPAGEQPFTSPVKSFGANNYGLHDMTGNVWEWCWDWYGSSAYVDSAINPRGAGTGMLRVRRGGSWADAAFSCRSAYRGSHHPSGGDKKDTGFRPARNSALATPVVISPTATNFTASTATLGGNVASDNGATIIERGILYSVTASNSNPVIAGTGVTRIVADGTTGVFTASVIGLTNGTGFSFKAYAINSEGTTYTNVATFATFSTNAELSALSLSSGTLSPPFSSDTTVYTASVSNATTSIAVTPNLAQANATVDAKVYSTVYGAVTSGSPSASLPLIVGDNLLTVRVTAQAGNTKTYIVEVKRMVDGTETTPTVTTPTATNITTIDATLGGNVTADDGDAITERGVVYSPSATNSNPSVGGAGVLKLSAYTTGTGVFTVPAAGLASGTSYSFKAYAINSRGTAYTNVASFLTLSSNADLGGLVLDGFSLSPSFTNATTTYTAAVQRSEESVRIRPMSTNSGASLFVRVSGGGWIPVSSGSLSLPLALDFGENLVDVRVIAEDGATEQLYSLRIFRNQPRPDAMVGSSFARMVGTNVYSSSSAQQLPLVARRARAVSGYVAVANRGNQPDRFNYRGNGDNRYFKVEYRNATGAFVSASVKAGLYHTSEMEPGAPVEWLRVTVTPVKKHIVVKRGKKTVTLRKAHTAHINATSVLDPAVVDGVSIRVKTR